ncbi:MAG: dadX [Rickettsiales bacterium]|jgi:alanine racemase|nr:dadX [Rickettsiales bacterium]
MPQNFSDSTLTINLSALEGNYRALATKAPSATTGAVVKANAYGLGAQPVAKTLYDAGCRHFFVAHLDEALELRPSLPNDSELYVFHGVHPGQESEFFEHRLIPVLNTATQLTAWRRFSLDKEQALPAILHVDTGMSRLGFSHDVLTNLDLSGLDIRYIMSHLACADTPKHSLNVEQKDHFATACKLFKNTKATLANSSGIYLGKEYHHALTRPGSALYGVNPTPEELNPMHPVVTLTSRILQLRTITKRTSIGYSATHILEPGCVVATIPVGYADGYFRSLSNKGYALLGKTRIPLIGRVSMDLITLDVTNVPENLRHEGAEVELLGQHITVDDLATDAGTIGYEVLTRLGNRYKRHWMKS